MLARSGCDPQEGVRFQSILNVEQQSILKDSIFRKGLLKCHPQSAIENQRWLKKTFPFRRIFGKHNCFGNQGLDYLYYCDFTISSGLLLCPSNFHTNRLQLLLALDSLQHTKHKGRAWRSTPVFVGPGWSWCTYHFILQVHAKFTLSKKHLFMNLNCDCLFIFLIRSKECIPEPFKQWSHCHFSISAIKICAFHSLY